jgi:hypothetical protein
MTGLIHRGPILLDERTYWWILRNEYLPIGKVIPKYSSSSTLLGMYLMML